MSYLEMLRLAAPELLVVLAGLLVLTADLVALRGTPVAGCYRSNAGRYWLRGGYRLAAGPAAGN